MKARLIIPLLASLLLLAGCKVTYSFSGTSIQADVNSITINFIEYRAPRVNPSLSNDLTEAIRNQFRRMTSLEQVDMDGDMELSGQITGYDVTAAAVTADEVAARNKLTVTVKIQFTDKKHPEENFDKSFSAYSEYDSTNTLDAVESSLCAEIIEKLVEDIFNASVAQW
ncbi:MAG: LptE family protein [Bacteroidales bacterium]|nr:LptE family protein [Bacteroidales bacterium]